jgi:hypothetical protein
MKRLFIFTVTFQEWIAIGVGGQPCQTATASTALVSNRNRPSATGS